MFVLFIKGKSDFWVYITMVLVFQISCTHRNTDDQTRKYADLLVKDNLELTGDYYWNFQLMGGTQRSKHSFYRDSIVYKMEGKVYSTDYTMQKLSYDIASNKWIGQDEQGIVYVLFFKYVTDSTISIYKHKCKTKGLEEALSFKIPDADATTDHGWNTYMLALEDEEDILTIRGNFFSGNNSLALSDRMVVYNGKTFEKLSYHLGERRWVGKANDNVYLQLFFSSIEKLDSLAISVGIFADLEKAYLFKYQDAKFKMFKNDGI
ncbi:MAG: hypothetical protein AAGF85_10100 [Bacteroidota bacterium]